MLKKRVGRACGLSCVNGLQKMKMTRFENSHGETIAADQKGNNVAFICQACDHPILMSQFPRNSGNVKCKGCNHDYLVDWSLETETIVISYEP